MIGTAIEFYDYYIYAAAAVLVFNTQFFDKSDENAAMLYSLSTLALAFLARPIGSALFGHFGDKLGRKDTLIVSILMMALPSFVLGLRLMLEVFSSGFESRPRAKSNSPLNSKLAPA